MDESGHTSGSMHYSGLAADLKPQWTYEHLDALVRERGPSCPNFDCDHVYCYLVREIRKDIGRYEAALFNTFLSNGGLKMPEHMKGLWDVDPDANPVDDLRAMARMARESQQDRAAIAYEQMADELAG